MKRIILITSFIMLIGNVMHVSAQYINLTANIVWNGPNIAEGTTTLADVEDAFNYARTQENIDLGTSIPAIVFPSVTVWNAKSINEKALWLVNQERTARGLVPFEAVAEQVTTVAQNYCQFLIDNDTTGHYADEHNPDWRLLQNSDIAACKQAYNENIAYFYSYNPTEPSMVLERLIYLLIYEDATSAWGHRKNFFTTVFNDNSGIVGAEGILGTGLVVSQEFKTYTWSAIVVFDCIDPCSSWVYPSVSTPQISNTTDIIQEEMGNIRISSNETITSISITDISGKVIERINEDIRVVSLQSYPKGIYIILVQTNKGVVHKRIIK